MLLMMNSNTIFTSQNHVVCYINDRKYFTSTSNLFLSNPMTFQQPLCLKNPQKPFHSSHLLRALTGKNNEQKWIHQGIITESLPDLMFRVRLDNGEEDPILGYLSGKMKMNHIRLLVGDKVKVELSRYDSTRGRIIYRQDSKDRTDKPPKKVKKKGSQNKKTRS